MSVREQKYIVHFAGIIQPVIAASAEIDGEVLLLTKHDGTLAAFFDLSVVEKWYLECEPKSVYTPSKPAGESNL